MKGRLSGGHIQMESGAAGVHAGLVNMKMGVVKRSANLAYVVSVSFGEVKVSKFAEEFPSPGGDVSLWHGCLKHNCNS